MSVAPHVEFFIPGVPQPKLRARVSFRGGKARAYTPERTANYEAFIVGIVREQVAKHGWSDRLPFGDETPLKVTMVLGFPRVKSWPKRRKHHVVKPDATNVAKSIEDALGTANVIPKDQAIVDLRVIKAICDEYTEPGVWVCITEADDDGDVTSCDVR